MILTRDTIAQHEGFLFDTEGMQWGPASEEFYRGKLIDLQTIYPLLSGQIPSSCKNAHEAVIGERYRNQYSIVQLLQSNVSFEEFGQLNLCPLAERLCNPLCSHAKGMAGNGPDPLGPVLAVMQDQQLLQTMSWSRWYGDISDRISELDAAVQRVRFNRIKREQTMEWVKPHQDRLGREIEEAKSLLKTFIDLACKYAQEIEGL